MSTALVIVDMQNYYLLEDGSFHSYYEAKRPGSMSYISKRARELVIPNITKLKEQFYAKDHLVYYLRLCGTKDDRSDLHRLFKIAYLQALRDGTDNLYPLASQDGASIVEELRPAANDRVFDKTTFSPFNSTDIDSYLTKDEVSTLVFTGLATSQCVDTSARDASDKGYTVIHITDAQTDYSEESHYASLYGSQPVCGGWVYDTDYFIDHFDTLLHNIAVDEHRY